MSEIDPVVVAKGLSEAQREMLLRHQPTLDEQEITEDECFHTGCELFVETPDGDAWLASMSAHSPEGSPKWDRCVIRYTPDGLAVRAILEEKDDGR